MLSDDELVAGFEAAALTEFHHADHVRLTIVYLARYGSGEALRRLTTGLRRLAAAGGQPGKFHVTMTRAWLELIEAARTAYPHATTPDALVDACPTLLDRNTLRRCYSGETLDSDRARNEWMPPDRCALDAALPGAPDEEPASDPIMTGC